MSTSSFNEKIVIDNKSASKLISKINYDRINGISFKEIDVQKELKESAKSLKALLFRQKDYNKIIINVNQQYMKLFSKISVVSNLINTQEYTVLT